MSCPNTTETTSNSGPPGADSAILSAVSCSASFCVAAGQLGELVTNYPASSAYTNIRPTVTNKRLTRVSCADTNDCWAVGDGGIFATSNGGTTWVNQHSASGVL